MAVVEAFGYFGRTCDLKSEDPYLDKDYAECRRNFVDGKHETWPIPQNQVDLMGADVFPQSDPWK